jgi:RpiR family transcriptional regulator, carbohydrate utilization regulator
MTSRLMHLMVIDVVATCLALRIGGASCSRCSRK